jgi:hypothetical protein
MDVAGNDADEAGALGKAAGKRGGSPGIAELQRLSPRIRQGSRGMMQERQRWSFRVDTEETPEIGLPLPAKLAELALCVQRIDSNDAQSTKIDGILHETGVVAQVPVRREGLPECSAPISVADRRV